MHDIEQKFSTSTAQEQLLREIAALRRLSTLWTRAADALSGLSLEAFALARTGDERADGPGAEFLASAEHCFAQAKSFQAEAEALWRRLAS